MSALLSYQDSSQGPVQVLISFDTERRDEVPLGELTANPKAFCLS
jgi:hypothetical protein